MKKYRVTFWCLANPLYETEIKFKPGDIMSHDDKNFVRITDLMDMYNFNCINGYYQEDCGNELNLINLSNVQRIQFEELEE
jgi:hypothetical protein